MIEPDDPGLWPPATKQRSPDRGCDCRCAADLVDLDVREEEDIEDVLAGIARERRSVNRRLGKRDVAIGFVVYLLVLTWIGSVLHSCRPHPAAPVPVPVEVEAK